MQPLLKRLGSIFRTSKPQVTTLSIPKQKQTGGLLGGFLDFSQSKLSDEKKISTKLLQANAGWVFINVSTIAEEVAKLEPELFSVGLVNGQPDLIQIDEHEVLDLLDRFNDSTTSSDGFYLTESHLDLAGDAFWYLEGGNNFAPPENLYILQPDKIELKLGNFNRDGGTLVEGYVLKAIIDGKPVEVPYEAEEIIHFKIPNPNNMYRGLSTVEAIADTIDADTYSNVVVRKMYEQGMITNFVLSTDQKINDDQLKRLNAELRAAYGGAKNAWKVPIFGGGITPNPVQMSSKDAEFILQQQWIRDKIMAAFKNTKSSLGIVEDVNRANAEASILNWKQSVIKPKMQRIVDSLNEFLVPRYGDSLILGFKDPVPEDRDNKIAEATGLKNADLISQNEARELLGYDPVEGGDEFNRERSERMQQQFAENFQDSLPKSIQNINFKRVFRRMGIYDKVKQHQLLKEAAMPMAREIVKGRKKPPYKEKGQKFTSDRIAAYYDKQLHIVETHEERFDQLLQGFINDLVGESLQALPIERPEHFATELFNREDKVKEGIAKFTPILTEVAIASGEQALLLIGSKQPYIPKTKAIDIRKFIQEQIEFFMGSMLDTDQEIMTDIITDGLQAGSSIPQIRKQILDKFTDYTKVQAERITRTEVLRTSNAAALDAWRDSGVVVGKQWLIAGAIDVCVDYDGQVVGINEEFSDGDPPLHPNCRCTLLPVIEGSEEFGARHFADRVRIKSLEDKIDKRTKEFRDLKQKELADAEYIKELETLIGIEHE